MLFQDRFIGLFLIGVLSMTFAEVFSGSSILWFINPWAWCVAFPLYWSHTLLFLNLAIRTRRSSVSHLYLWGVLFGLYESWVTKVLWAGYIGAEPGLGLVMGIAVAEFITLTMVWHPLMSFVIPVLVYEAIAVSIYSTDMTAQLLPNHVIHLAKRQRISLLWAMVVIGGASFLSWNSGLDPFVTGITSVGSMLIIIVLVRLCKGRPGACSIKSIVLGRRGLGAVSVYLILLYAITFPFLLPERIPSIDTIFITVIIYLSVLVLISLTPQVTTTSSDNTLSSLYTWDDIQERLGVFALLSISFCLVSVLSFLLTVLGMMFMLFSGVPIFLIIVSRLLARRVTRQ